MFSALRECNWTSDPLMNTPRALDETIAANLQVRRKRLERATHSQRVCIGVGNALFGCMGLFALAALFVAKDDEAALIVAMMTGVLAGFTYVAGKAGRKRAVDSLRELN